MAEWLLRFVASEVGVKARTGSNPVAVVFFFVCLVDWRACGTLIMDSVHRVAFAFGHGGERALI